MKLLFLARQSKSAAVKPLDEHQRLELKNWLHRNALDSLLREKKCADCIGLVNALEKLLPDFHDLCNLNRSTMKDLKKNWKLFNSSILQKLGLGQEREVLKLYAKGDPMAKDQVLYGLMKRVKTLQFETKWQANKTPANPVPDKKMDILVYTKVGHEVVKEVRSMLSLESYLDDMRASKGQTTFLGMAVEKFAQLDIVCREKRDLLDKGVEYHLKQHPATILALANDESLLSPILFK